MRKLKEWEAGYVVVYDADLCSGCRTCETICALTHEKVVNPKNARIRVEREFLNGNVCSIYTCTQCEDARCVQACPVDAIYEHPVSHAKCIDQEKCIGCGMCVKSCVASPPRIYLDKKERTARKCDLCDGEPMCVQACPLGALAYKAKEV